MVNLYIVSTTPNSGKTSLCLALGLHYNSRGLKVKYMKPVAAMAVWRGKIVSQDASFILPKLGLDDPMDVVAPLLINQDALEDLLKTPYSQLVDKITSAYKALTRDCDLLLLDGAKDIMQGYALKLAASHIASILDARVILVTSYRPDFPIDEVVAARDSFSGRLIGVIVNKIAEGEFDAADKQKKLLSSFDVPVIGLLPEDKLLTSISVRELAELLDGQVICSDEECRELVENFSVGAMNVDQALTYFRRTPRKAVITGGDRADIQIAALETDTKCLILTGNTYPSGPVLSHAQEHHTPIIIVPTDTIETVRRVDEALGHIRLKHERQIQRLMEIVDKRVDFAVLEKAMGLQMKS